MTNQNNEFGKSPVKLSSPTQIWIDDVNQNNELDRILTKAFNDFYDYITEKDIIKVAHEYSEKTVYKTAKADIQALYAPKPVEKVNKTTNSVDLSAPKVNLIDIASPNMSPEASKAVDDALERSMEKMRATPESNESKMVTIAVDKNLIPTVWCDPDIADLVTALNLAEIPTIASCSGHGLRNGNIALEDGRELIIAENFEEARRMENATQKAKNIRLTRAEPVESGELRETILSILGIVDRTSGNRPEQIATLEQEITAHTNAEVAKVLDRLESTAVYAEYDKAEDDVICGDVVPLDAIEAERAKLKELV